MNDFRLRIREGSVFNKNPFVDLGRESDDLVKIIVAIFDVSGFTEFFNSIHINKNIVTTSFINGLLYWFHYRFEKYYTFRPVFSKFLGDGILMIWEPGHQEMHKREVISLMNLCWDMVASDDSFESEYIPEFKRKVGEGRRITYPSKLKVGLSLGHAVKYVKGRKASDYISECINTASRLVKFHKDIKFLAHSDLVVGPIPRKFRYIKKIIRLRGIGDICVFVDKSDYEKAGAPKKFKALRK